MNILMISNTFTPHVGGVAKSVEAFTAEYRERGHRVLVIAPEFEGMPENEFDVIRVPAIQKFNGSDFSVRLPIPGFISSSLAEFQPDIVHSHHPFLLGDTALLIAAEFDSPLVFTHHTLYERYTHYVPGDSPALRRFVIQLSTGFANLCEMVFAPSQSVADLIKNRGVNVPINIIPTGVDVPLFSKGDGSAIRDGFNIPKDAFLVGHTGRLAPEKNLLFLAKAVADFLKRMPNAHFLIIGEGPSKKDILDIFKESSLSHRLHFTGILKGRELVNAYHAMDVFAFASKSETQGMVLTEAIAAGVPLVGLDASGVREVIREGQNGRLLFNENIDEFASALSGFAKLSQTERDEIKIKVRKTAETFSMKHCSEKALKLYETLLASDPSHKNSHDSLWHWTRSLIETEWEIWMNRTQAAGAAFHFSADEDQTVS